MEQDNGQPHVAKKQPERRQIVRFAFFKLDPAWRRLPEEERAASKREFTAAVREIAAEIGVKSYSLVGTRGDTDFMLWFLAQEIEQITAASTRIFSTHLGQYLQVPYSYLAMTRKSVYVENHHHEGQEGTRLTLHPSAAKFLFVYPFWKTRHWFQLSKAERQQVMDEHIRVGHKYPSVKLNTTYAFGLDDPEWVVAFESDLPEDFLALIMELRETKGSLYTLRDTPIFTCQAMDIAATLESLGGYAATAQREPTEIGRR